MNKTKFYLISHFHWDREWYQPFEEYRFRLVRAIDGLLDIMESDPDYKYFHFDGQTIVIDDYLRIRPQNRERLLKLIKEGRILIGSWYVMPDEFLVSGESLVRNLQKGFSICRGYGVTPMNNYYVTDIFGHNSQSPQIARGFGLEAAALYRGIGDYPKDMFRWRGADGSEVDCYKLDRNYSYGTFYFAARQPFDGREFNDAEMLERVRKYIDYSKSMAVSDAILAFDGCDHADPEPELSRIVRLLNDSFDDVEFIHTTINDFAADIKKKSLSLEPIEGVLYNCGREGVNNFLLQNVLSSCVVLKQQNAWCEALLTRIAEPLDAAATLLCDPPQSNREYTAAPRSDFFREAWDLLLQNQPHDSICGCSVGEVHEDNEYRFRHVGQICNIVLEDTLRQISKDMDTTGIGKDGAFLLYNPSPSDVCGQAVITLKLPAEQDTNFTLYDADGKELDFQILKITSSMSPVHQKLALVQFQVFQYVTVSVHIDLPAYSFRALTFSAPVPQERDPVYNGTPAIRTKYLDGSMRTAPRCFDNGVLLVRAENDGTLTVTDKATQKTFAGLLSLEDGGDNGDGWRYIPPQFDEKQYSTKADVSVITDGPHCAQLAITHQLAGLTVKSTVTILKGSTQLSVTTELNNTKTGHRLRVVLPTGIKSGHYYTRLPYDMYRWAVERPDNTDFFDRDTGVTPSQGATLVKDADSAFAVYTKGLYEVQVTQETVYLTLFRSVDNEVGRTEGSFAKMLRELTLEYALDFDQKLTAPECYKRSELFQTGLVSSLCGVHSGKLSGLQTPFGLKGDSALIISAVQPDFETPDGKRHFAVRVLNLSEKEAAGELCFAVPPKRVVKTMLSGETLEEIPVSDAKIPIQLTGKQLVNYIF